ncbi:MAG: hypothetical protein OHK0015_09350 [Chloroflexi bacterium OHK40]
MSSTSLGTEQNLSAIERRLSLGAGALLAFLALRRAPLALILAGAALFLGTRGSKGFCPIYDALGISSVREHPPFDRFNPATDRRVDLAVEDSFPASDPPAGVADSSFTQVDR